MLIIHDNGVDRQMTASEEAAHAQTVADIEADMERAAAEAQAALEARKAPLRRLGLTDDEINTVLGL